LHAESNTNASQLQDRIQKYCMTVPVICLQYKQIGGKFRHQIKAAKRLLTFNWRHHAQKH
jgi:hypothetical protein